MRHLKLFVSLFFILFALTFFGQRWFTASSASKDLAGSAMLPPNGVSASDGDYADKVGVMWNTRRGATLYRIFRSTSSDPSSTVTVGATAANYFFDTTAVPNQTYFYWVRSEKFIPAESFVYRFDSERRFQSAFF